MHVVGVRIAAAGAEWRAGSPIILSGAKPMTVNIVLLQPVVALIAGILILLVPRLLNYIVAIYLILIGIAGVLPHITH